MRLSGALSLVDPFYGEVAGETIEFIKEPGTLEIVRKLEGKGFDIRPQSLTGRGWYWKYDSDV